MATPGWVWLTISWCWFLLSPAGAGGGNTDIRVIETVRRKSPGNQICQKQFYMGGKFFFKIYSENTKKSTMSCVYFVVVYDLIA
jgi:hypothetical protein